MGSNYTGLARPLVGQDAPSPSPSPGGAPIVTVPADIDANNVATMFAQQYPTAMDWIAWLNAGSRICPPVVYGSNLGFSAITHVGPGTGTIAVSGKAHGGIYFVAKILTSGGAGVGTWAFSRDGGATYPITGGTIPGGGFSDGTSGVTILFSGTFTAGDTYAFHSAFTPQQQWMDQGTIGRYAIDHNGLDIGSRITRIDELFRGAVAGSTVDPIAATPWLSFTRSGTTFNYTVALNAVNYQTTLALTPGANASGDFAYVSGDILIVGPGTGVANISVLEFELMPSAVGVNNVDIYAGWGGGKQIHTATDYACFKLPSGASSVWHFVTKNAGGTNDQSSTITAVANVWTRFRIETHGLGTPLANALGIVSGGISLFFINDTYVGQSQTNNPVAATGIRPTFGEVSTAVTAGTVLNVSPWSVRVPRVLAGSTI